jgi:predicted ABC-type ATPase
LPKRFPTDRFLNADNIAKALATDSRIEAGKVMLRRMQELRDRRQTFAFETTLAGRSYARFLRDAKELGYRLHLAYVWLSNVELAKKRVAVRVARGGHNIPASDIERRYWRSVSNLFKIYLPLANRWALCDNSGRKLVVVARGRMNDEPAIYDQRRFDRIRDAAGQD